MPGGECTTGKGERCICIADAKKPRDFTRFTQEYDAGYRMPDTGLTCIFNCSLVRICVILWLAKQIGGG